MQIREINQYTVYYTDGKIELVNAETYVEALSNIEGADDNVAKIAITRRDIRTVIPELPDIIAFTAVVSDGSEEDVGNRAFPASGTVHIGDEIMLTAVPAEGYEFIKWERNGELLTSEPSLEYVMAPLEEGETDCIFTAVFSAVE